MISISNKTLSIILFIKNNLEKIKNFKKKKIKFFFFNFEINFINLCFFF